MSDNDVFEALRREYESDRVGRLILGEVERAARIVYAGRSPDAVGELVQETFRGALLGKERQLDYIMDVARDVGHFRGLIFKQAKRSAGRIRRHDHTVIDNLIARSRRVLTEPPFVAERTAAEMTYRFGSQNVEDRVPTTEEKRRAIVRASVVPKVVPKREAATGEEHAPVVYSPEGLVAVLTAVADELPTTVTESDLREIFEQVLTDWFPVFLEEERELSASGGDLSPDEVTVVNEITERVMTRVDEGHPDLAIVLRLDLAGEKDEDIAAVIGVQSRGTVINRHKVIERIMREELESQSLTIANAVLREIGLRLAGREDQSRG